MAVAGALVLASVATGCPSLMQGLRDYNAPPGQLSRDDTINPCHGQEVDPQRCGDATFHARQISKLTLGTDRDDVRRIMRHEPDDVRRDGTTERWTYLTDYQRGRTTVLVFRDGRLTDFDAGPATQGTR